MIQFMLKDPDSVFRSYTHLLHFASYHRLIPPLHRLLRSFKTDHLPPTPSCVCANQRHRLRSTVCGFCVLRFLPVDSPFSSAL
ncbi:hypothetical protein L1887_12192 [Cichorium endivia]|nr:hypothetical protein L1887_12192 [Cichorium endivia]